MRGKRLTLKEKKYLASIELDPAEWLMYRKNESGWTILNRETKQIKKIT